MAENTKIQWTDHSWNPWRGCTKVSAGCANCYAESGSKQNPGLLGKWGPNGTRVVASEAMWGKPRKWDDAARRSGERPRVFTASYADVFEEWAGPMVDIRGRNLYRPDIGEWLPVANGDPLTCLLHRVTMDDVRSRAFGLVAATPRLDWLVLTKRPEAMRRYFRKRSAMWSAAGSFRDLVYGHGSDVGLGSGLESWPPRNMWAGTTVEDRAAKVRIDDLREVRAKVRFISAEPLIEDLGAIDLSGIHWVIVGGESGHGARPFDLAWARSIRDQCRAAGVAFFMKQYGAMPFDSRGADHIPGIDRLWTREEAEASPEAFAFGLELACETMNIDLADSHGGDWDEWPTDDLKVREFPKVVGHA